MPATPYARAVLAPSASGRAVYNTAATHTHMLIHMDKQREGDVPTRRTTEPWYYTEYC